MSTEHKIKNIYRMVIAPDADVKIRDIAQKAMQAMRENGKIIFDDRNPDSIPVLVGRVHDMTSEKIYSSLAFNSFCIAARDDRIDVAAWSYAVMRNALDRLLQKVYGLDGKRSLYEVIESAELREKYGEPIEVPPYPSGSLRQIFDCNDGVYQLYFTDTDEEGHKEYCRQLEKMGYTCYDRHSFSGNLFATYNESKTGKNIFLSYTSHDRVSRVTVGDKSPMLPVIPVTGKAICSSWLTMISIGKLPDGGIDPLCPFGVSFVIRLDDGRFIVIDGGVNNPNEVEKLYQFLLSNAPDRENIVIAAWILTHPDGDHWGAMYGFSEKYAHSVRLEKILYNIFSPDAEFGMKPAACGAGARVHDIYVPQIAKNLDCDCIIKLHTGQKFYIGKILFEVMFTHEDLYPVPVDHTNDSSLVLKMTVGDKVFMLDGDIEGAAARQVNAQCGEYLKSDYVQVIHHGWRGISMEEINFNKPHYGRFYELCAADYALWSAQLDKFHYDLLVKADETVVGSVNWLRSKVKKMYSTEDGNQIILF